MVTLFKASRYQNIGMMKIHVTETKIISLKQTAKNTPTPITKKKKKNFNSQDHQSKK